MLTARDSRAQREWSLSLVQVFGERELYSMTFGLWIVGHSVAGEGPLFPQAKSRVLLESEECSIVASAHHHYCFRTCKNLCDKKRRVEEAIWVDFLNPFHDGFASVYLCIIVSLANRANRVL